MSTPLCIIQRDVPEGREQILRKYLKTDWRIETANMASTPDKFRALARDVVAIVGGRFEKDLPDMPKLKLYHIPFAGYDSLDLSLLPTGCALANTYEHETAIAEWVLLAMLEHEIKMSRDARVFKANGWETPGVGGGRGTHGEVMGKTVGIVGYGRIGKEIVTRAKAFGMRCVATSRRDMPCPAELDAYWPVERLNEMLAEADYVVVATPLNEDTRDMFDAARIAAMKPSAVIINVGRGEVINPEALYNALKDQRIGGAVIDVWYDYRTETNGVTRPSTFPFHELDNIVMTPHNCAWTDQMIERRWAFIATNLDRLARGEAPENVVAIGA